VSQDCQSGERVVWGRGRRQQEWSEGEDAGEAVFEAKLIQRESLDVASDLQVKRHFHLLCRQEPSSHGVGISKIRRDRKDAFRHWYRVPIQSGEYLVDINRSWSGCRGDDIAGGGRVR
jgi:hypothetical protein